MRQDGTLSLIVGEPVTLHKHSRTKHSVEMLSPLLGSILEKTEVRGSFIFITGYITGHFGLIKHASKYLLVFRRGLHESWLFCRHATYQDIAAFVHCKLSADRQFLNTRLGLVRIYVPGEGWYGE